MKSAFAALALAAVATGEATWDNKVCIVFVWLLERGTAFCVCLTYQRTLSLLCFYFCFSQALAPTEASQICIINQGAFVLEW